MNNDDLVEPVEQDEDIDEQFEVHLRKEREKLADMLCPPPPLEDDVELLDAPDGEDK